MVRFGNIMPEGGEVVSDTPVYLSTCTFKNIWQEYRIFDDRLEFDTIFGQMTIPFEHVERVEVLDADTKALIRGDLRLKNFRPALKIDWANFLDHVVLDKNDGHVRRILFSPEDPEAFKNALEEAITRFLEIQSESSD